MNKFNDIDYLPLRVWNRTVMLFNIREDSGENAAKEYASQFSKQELAQMLDLYHLVKKNGPEKIKKMIMANMPLEEEEIVD